MNIVKLHVYINKLHQLVYGTTFTYNSLVMAELNNFYELYTFESTQVKYKYFRKVFKYSTNTVLVIIFCY